VVMRGKGEDKVEVDIKREEVESGLHLYRAGLSINDIEKKSGSSACRPHHY